MLHIYTNRNPSITQFHDVSVTEQLHPEQEKMSYSPIQLQFRAIVSQLVLFIVSSHQCTSHKSLLPMWGGASLCFKNFQWFLCCFFTAGATPFPLVVPCSTAFQHHCSGVQLLCFFEIEFLIIFFWLLRFQVFILVARRWPEIPVLQNQVTRPNTCKCYLQFSMTCESKSSPGKKLKSKVISFVFRVKNATAV